jgi:hypothetical protein
MDLSSSQTTEEQSRRIFLILSMLCKEVQTEGFWKLLSISMQLTADEIGFYYLVQIKLIDIDSKIDKINIRRNGTYYFVEEN